MQSYTNMTYENSYYNASFTGGVGGYIDCYVHMDGGDFGGDGVEILAQEEDDSWTTLWSRNSHWDASWHNLNISLENYTSSTQKIRLQHSGATGWFADAAFDDVTIGYTGTVLDTEGFESTLGDWSNQGTDNWERHTGSTTSDGTGPSSAYEGSYYIYTECSGDAYSNTFTLEITVDLSSSVSGDVDANIISENITKQNTNWDKFYADVNNTENSTFSLIDPITEYTIISGLNGDGDDISSVSNNTVRIRGDFNATLSLDGINITWEPDIEISFHDISSGWFSFANTSISNNTIDNGFFSFSNNPTNTTIESGWFSFSNTTVSNTDISSGWFTFSNNPTNTTLYSGWFSFSNTSNYLSVDSGWFSFSNETVSQNTIDSGWFSFSNTSNYVNIDDGWFSFTASGEWQNMESGWFSFTNESAYVTIDVGWFSFENTSISNTTIDEGWFSIPNELEWVTLDSGWFSFSTYQTTEQGWFSFTAALRPSFNATVEGCYLSVMPQLNEYIDEYRITIQDVHSHSVGDTGWISADDYREYTSVFEKNGEYAISLKARGEHSSGTYTRDVIVDSCAVCGEPTDEEPDKEEDENTNIVSILNGWFFGWYSLLSPILQYAFIGFLILIASIFCFFTYQHFKDKQYGIYVLSKQQDKKTKKQEDGGNHER